MRNWAGFFTETRPASLSTITFRHLQATACSGSDSSTSPQLAHSYRIRAPAGYPLVASTSRKRIFSFGTNFNTPFYFVGLVRFIS